MDTMKRNVCGAVSGRQHNSQGLNLFFHRMLLVASLVQQKGRLREKRQYTLRQKSSLYSNEAL